MARVLVPHAYSDELEIRKIVNELLASGYDVDYLSEELCCSCSEFIWVFFISFKCDGVFIDGKKLLVNRFAKFMAKMLGKEIICFD